MLELNSKSMAVVFIGTSVYLNYFERFKASVLERFAPGTAKRFFVFSDNHLETAAEDVEFTKVPFDNKRDVKLKKCHYINSVAPQLEKFEYVFYFDADSVVVSQVALETVKQWLSGETELVGVMHPWPAIRDGNRRFEKDPGSTAYVSPEETSLMPYHQSSFWGGKASAVLEMCRVVEDMVQQDLSHGWVNEFLICDEIYFNRYFLSHRNRLCSLDTEFAHPGEEYERFTAQKDRPGYRFHATPVVVHDNANQTKSWQRSRSQQAFFTYGAYLQFFQHDLAVYHALASFRRFNPENPINLVSDGGDDPTSLAAEFHCKAHRAPFKNGTYRSRAENTDHRVWLKRIYEACLTTLAAVDWVILLEPDVECFAKPAHFPEYALSGPSPGPHWTPELKALFQGKFGRLTRNFGLGHNYTGCGGSIFNRERFVECFENTPSDVLEAAHVMDARVLKAEDATISFLFQVNGFDTGGWADFTGWQNEQHAGFSLVHGNKQFYGKPSPLISSRSA